MSDNDAKNLTRRDVYEELCGALKIAAVNKKNPELVMLSTEQIDTILDNLFGPEKEETECTES